MNSNKRLGIQCKWCEQSIDWRCFMETSTIVCHGPPQESDPMHNKQLVCNCNTIHFCSQLKEKAEANQTNQDNKNCTCINFMLIACIQRKEDEERKIQNHVVDI